MDKFLHFLLNEKNETRVTEEEKERLIKALNRIKANRFTEMCQNGSKGVVLDIELNIMLNEVEKMIEKFYMMEISLKEIEEYQQFWIKYQH